MEAEFGERGYCFGSPTCSGLCFGFHFFKCAFMARVRLSRVDRVLCVLSVGGLNQQLELFQMNFDQGSAWTNKIMSE